VIYRAFYIYRNIPVTYLPGLKCYLSNRFIPPVDPTTSGGASLYVVFNKKVGLTANVLFAAETVGEVSLRPAYMKRRESETRRVADSCPIHLIQKRYF